MTTGNETTVSSSGGVGGTVGTGELQFFGSYFSDNTFVQELDGSDLGFLGSMMFLGVYPFQPLNGVYFYVPTCTITDGTHSFNIVENGCVSALGQLISPFATESMFQLQYTAFTFAGKF